MRVRFIFSLVLCCVGWLAACSSAEQVNATPLPVNVELVFQGAHCMADTASVRPITDGEDWHSATRVESLGLPTKSVPPPLFEGGTFYLINAGQRPSAGYEFVLQTPFAHWKNGRWIPDLILRAPQAIAAAVITSPCAIIRLAGEGRAPLHWAAGAS